MNAHTNMNDPAPKSSLWRFSLTLPKDKAFHVAEQLDDVLFAHETYADTVISLFESPSHEHIFIVEGVLSREPDPLFLENQIRILCQQLDEKKWDEKKWDAKKRDEFDADASFTVNVEALPEKDWLAENRKQFPALSLAGFYVYGSHIKDPQPNGLIPLQIDASTAFGTGNHGTTHGCLAALQTLKKNGFLPQNAMDLGTGTGILAMGIVSLFPVTCIATDIDDDAVEKAAYNVTLNDLSERVTVIKADGLEHEAIVSSGPYDLFVANILAGPLCEMATDIKANVAKNGYLILSGILDYQVDMIKQAYCEDTFCLRELSCIGEWATFVFQKA